MLEQECALMGQRAVTVHVSQHPGQRVADSRVMCSGDELYTARVALRDYTTTTLFKCQGTSYTGGLGGRNI